MTLSSPDVLELAADLIENVGWSQRHIFQFSGAGFEVEDRELIGMCVNGACAIASRRLLGMPDFFWEEAWFGRRDLTILQDAVDEMQKHLGYAPSQWNDEDGRTKEQVIETLRIVAKDLRNNATVTP